VRGRVKTLSCNALRADPAGTISGYDLGQRDRATVIQGLLAQCDAQAPQVAGELQDDYDRFALPGSLSASFGIAQSIGLILIAIMTASAVGSDYGLGTLRTSLTRGTGRWQYLSAKFLMLIGAAAVAFLTVCIATLISSAIAGGIASPPAGGAASTASWSGSFLDLGRAWTSVVPYVALTAMATVLTRSTAAGMGIGLGYFIAEGIAIDLLSALFDWFQNVADYLPVRNITAFAGGNVGFRSTGAQDIGTVHAGLVLACYLLAFCVIALRVFQRRDVAGSSGG
jgi:ABC-2 type transport system permease protein